MNTFADARESGTNIEDTNIGRRRMLSGVAAASALGFVASSTSSMTMPEANGSTSRAASAVTVNAVGLRIAGVGGGVIDRSVGATALISADVVLPGSDVVGALHGEYRVIAASGVVGVQASTSIETHYFEFPDGSIVGTGTASLDDSDDSFVIVGGTGAFVGARGTYTAQQQPLGLGGDGTATYRFTFLNQQGA